MLTIFLYRLRIRVGRFEVVHHSLALGHSFYVIKFILHLLFYLYIYI